jgi:hypothetical protein
LIICATLFSLWPQASAAELHDRSITLGSSQPSAVTTHAFSFNLATSGTLGSIDFEYCSNGSLPGTPCTPPTGLSLLGANLQSQSGATGFSISPLTTANDLIITRAPAPDTPGPATYNFSNIVNPSTVNQSMYVRLSTYASTDATGPTIDNGAVVFDLSLGLGATGFVPPRLVLCVGATVAVDCSAQVHDIKDLGDLSPQVTGSTTTQFSVATNYPTGYNVYVLGNTLTSGNNVIPAITSPQRSIKGIGQFGLNLVANGSPPVGADPFGAGTGVVDAGYNSPDFYKFQAGDLVADSPLSTDYSLFTVSYIANVDQAQPVGVYATTMIYLAMGSF